ncbi:MAG: hypothetical protein LBF64_05775, partial [Oscillospiraceae bacterium]|nr:hypothetical protein [Oscillospiraceae bacterium]
IGPGQIRNAEEGLFTLSAGQPVTIGGLRLGAYQVTEMETTAAVSYQVSAGGAYMAGRTAPILLAQEETAQSVIFLNAVGAPSISVRKKSGAPGNPSIGGAEFSLRREGGGYDSGLVRTNAQGGLTFAGLPSYPLFAGTYLLTEESVPGDRHDLLSAPITLEIAPDGQVTGITPAEADKALVSVEGLGTGAVTVTVTDVYHQPPSTVRIHGRKGILGVSSTEERFRFTLTQVADLQGTPLGAPLFEERRAQTNGSLTVGAPQMFVFEEIVFPEGASGAYYFKLTEEAGSAPDWDYDSAFYVARVDVDPGTGIAAVSWPGTDFSNDAPPMFVNVYRPSYSIVFHGRKAVSGVGSTDRPFSFTLAQVRDAEGTPLGESDPRLAAPLTVSTAGVITDGVTQTFTFPAIEDVGLGTYYFKLTEDIESVFGWSYDSAFYIARVTVSEGGGVDIEWLDPRYSEDVPPLFRNVYRPLYTMEIRGRKDVSHATEEVFNFTLTQVRDAAGTPLGVSDEEKIPTLKASTAGPIAPGAPQTVTFPQIENVAPGTYYLRITEDPGDTARWTYDSAAYVAQVFMSDTGAVAITWIDHPEYSETAPPLFRNTYSPPSTSHTPLRSNSPTPPPDGSDAPDEPGESGEPGEPGEPGGSAPNPHDAGDSHPPGYGDEDAAPPAGGFAGGTATPPGRVTDMPRTGGMHVVGGLLLFGLLLAAGGGALALLDRRRGKRRRAESARE